MKRICFYHAGCPDGFGAVWASWRAWGEDGRYVARGHDDRADPAECEDHEVVFVDIAPGNEEVRELADVAARVVVLDHHVSSYERFSADLGLANELEAEGHAIHFELDHSGAVLAWQFFHPDEPVPDLLRYVEDQDLWNWKLPQSHEVNAAILSYPRTFSAWSALAARGIEELASEGEPIVRANRVEVDRMVSGATPIRVDGATIEAVNASQNRSLIGHALAKRSEFGAPWACVYRVSGDRVYATLYSIGDFDVSRIAGSYGGGGHRNAAGFSVSLQQWLGDFLGVEVGV